MGSKTHAILSASSSHRWLKCPPSARLQLEFPDTTSEAAEEGTAAHALAEHKLRRLLKMRSRKPTSQYDSDDMDMHTDGYVAFVSEAIEAAKKHCSDVLILIEQRLDFSEYVPDGFGIGDCVIVADDNLHIIDLKYGQGVLVEAENNSQMMLYALGALHAFDSIYDIQTVSMSIYQPRRENVSTWTISVDKLKDWAENTLRPTAKLAFAGEGEFCCGEWCRFCAARTTCRARATQQMELAKHEFAMPPTLTDDEVNALLPSLDDLITWASDIKEYALKAALSGKRWSGYKLVAGRSIRHYTDEDAVAEAARKAGYTDIYKTSLIGVSEMEKLMGKRNFADILGGLVDKPQGKPTLVPDSDKRPEMQITSAADDFNDNN